MSDIGVFDVPYISIKEYARRSGETEHTVRHQIKSKNSHFILKPRTSPKETIYINIAAMNARALKQRY